MNFKRATITELLVKGIMLFSILTVIQGISIFENINKLWIVIISCLLVVRLCTYKYNTNQVIMLFLASVLHIIAVYFTDFPLEQVNILFYFALWVMIFIFFSKSKRKIIEILDQTDGYILAVLWTWTVVVGVSALLPFCYKDKYFVSFTGSSFRLMPAVLIIAALAMYMAISRNDKRYELFLILPTYAAFMNQSRTYFGVYILFLMMYIYMRFKSKRMFYTMLIPIALVIGLLMAAGGIMDKILATQYKSTSYFDFWGTITSGRTVFWLWDLEAFFALPFWQQFVGNGFNFVYDVNGANMSRIWAHNDIINLLMNFGYIGVMIYLWVYFLMIKKFWPKGNRIPLEVKVMFHGAVFINSMMNMSYTYLCAMISYPLFLCVIAERYSGEEL